MAGVVVALIDAWEFLAQFIAGGDPLINRRPFALKMMQKFLTHFCS
jgi:hypothetical protein